ncbi:MAG: NUDIX domain-containing protein, partial [Actinobacteria bacterium]|nr:NUDIX domain-containing protein [Actinomycetota bacterium]
MGSAPEPLRASTHGKVDRASAVLAALYGQPLPSGTAGAGSTVSDAGNGEAHIVLTRRAQHMRSHRGEVSFPGGGQDPGEDLWSTALREAREEIALDSSLVTRIGELDHLRTMTS